MRILNLKSVLLKPDHHIVKLLWRGELFIDLKTVRQGGATSRRRAWVITSPKFIPCFYCLMQLARSPHQRKSMTNENLMDLTVKKATTVLKKAHIQNRELGNIKKW